MASEWAKQEASKYIGGFPTQMTIAELARALDKARREGVRIGIEAAQQICEQRGEKEEDRVKNCERTDSIIEMDDVLAQGMVVARECAGELEDLDSDSVLAAHDGEE